MKTEILYEDFMADVDRLLNKPKVFKIDVLTKEQKTMLIEARKKVSLEKCCYLCEKHFRLKISLSALRDFFQRELNNDSLNKHQ